MTEHQWAIELLPVLEKLSFANLLYGDRSLKPFRKTCRAIFRIEQHVIFTLATARVTRIWLGRAIT